MKRTDLRRSYLQLAEMSEDASRSEKQRRGYELEKIIYELLLVEGLAPRTRYRLEGEEIDGSFWLNGRTYILEIKWHYKPLPVSATYAFKSKIEGKLDGTIGVFISISGFSQEGVEALGRGKKLNVILFDRDDIEACILGKSKFRMLMEQKLRAAAEEGIVYLKLHRSLRRQQLVRTQITARG